MPTKNDEDVYNPSVQHARNTLGEDQRPGTIDMSDFESRGVASQQQIDAKKSELKDSDSNSDNTEQARQSESAASKATGNALTAATAGNPVAGVAVKAIYLLKTNKRKAAGGGIAAGVITLFIMAVTFIGTSLGPISFAKTILDDLSDQVAVMDNYTEKTLRTKLQTVDEQFISGCGQRLSFRCKLKTLSSNDVRRLQLTREVQVIERARIGIGPASRVFVEAYVVNGVRYDDAAAFRNAYYSDASFRKTIMTVKNNKHLGHNDKKSRWVTRVANASRAKPVLAGDNSDAKLANLSQGTPRGFNPQNPRWIAVDPNDTSQGWTIDGDDSGRVYSNTEKTVIDDGRNRLSGLRSQAGSSVIKSASIIGSADLVCTVRNMIGVAAITAKILKHQQLIAYAMTANALTAAAMAGDLTVEEGEVMGRFFMETDNRREIEDTEATLQRFSENNPNADIADISESDVVYKPNPDFGKNATDNEFYQAIAHGSTFQNSASTEPYMLGASENTFAAIFGSTAAFLTSSTLVSARSCAVVQSWFVRGFGLAAGIGLMFVPGLNVIRGADIARNLAFSAMIIGGLIILGQTLDRLVQGEVVPEDIVDRPVERGAAVTAGLAGLTASTNLGRGMQPSNKEDFLQYRQLSIESNQHYAAIERQQAPLFSLNNPHSASNQVLLAFGKYRPKDQTVSSQLASIQRLLGDAASTLSGTSTYAQTIDYANRFERCVLDEDDEYNRLGLDPDIMCNIRYSVSSRVLNMEPDDITNYMMQNNYVEEETGLPDGYTPPNPNQASSFSRQILDGIVSDFYSTRNYNQFGDYGRFLDYCVYRTTPLGKTYEETGAFGAAGAEWVNGDKCVEKSVQLDYFRAFTILSDTLDINEPPEVFATGSGGGSQAPPLDQPENTRTQGRGWLLVNGQDYSDYRCAAGTADKGLYNHPTNNTTIRLCELSGKNFASIISPQIVAMFDKAKSQGINLIITSGHRTYEDQLRLWNERNCSGDGSDCAVAPTAPPGTSNHESGVAIDLGLESTGAFCFPSGRTCPGNIGYEFMVKEGAGYGLFKLPSEAWHWETGDYGA